MSLVVAIESDHRQAGHLVQIVRRRLNAELLIAETFEAALPAIGNRVPDLILVPALLSPEDDAALKFVLRVISDGRHVQVLTTPMFAGSRLQPSSRRMLPGFLRTRTAAADGCDPDEFARHIASYLEAAAHKRATAPPPVATRALHEHDAVLAVEAEPPVVEMPPTELPDAEEPAAEFVAPMELVDEVMDPVVVDEVIDPVVVEEPIAQPAKPPVTVDAAALDRLVSDLDRLFAAAPVASAGVPTRPVPHLEAIDHDDGDCRASVTPALTLEQLAAEVDFRFPEPPPERLEPGPDPNAPADEWGLFDPGQCGIEALLVKLRVAPRLL